jgi:hypothetical protein
MSPTSCLTAPPRIRHEKNTASFPAYQASWAGVQQPERQPHIRNLLDGDAQSLGPFFRTLLELFDSSYQCLRQLLPCKTFLDDVRALIRYSADA